MAPLVCETCTKTFKFQSGFSRHIHASHKGKPHVTCTCGLTFARRDSLKRHQIRKSCTTENLQLISSSSSKSSKFTTGEKNLSSTTTGAHLQSMPSVHDDDEEEEEEEEDDDNDDDDDYALPAISRTKIVPKVAIITVKKRQRALRFKQQHQKRKLRKMRSNRRLVVVRPNLQHITPKPNMRTSRAHSNNYDFTQRGRYGHKQQYNVSRNIGRSIKLLARGSNVRI